MSFAQATGRAFKSSFPSTTRCLKLKKHTAPEGDDGDHDHEGHDHEGHDHDESGNKNASGKKPEDQSTSSASSRE